MGTGLGARGSGQIRKGKGDLPALARVPSPEPNLPLES